MIKNQVIKVNVSVNYKRIIIYIKIWRQMYIIKIQQITRIDLKVQATFTKNSNFI